MAIGADVDQYNTYPEVQSALISSVIKNVDVAVYNYLKSVADGSVKAGISTSTLQNGGGGTGDNRRDRPIKFYHGLGSEDRRPLYRVCVSLHASAHT